MAFGGSLNHADDVISEINMVPLIDVMLVLLIIFHPHRAGADPLDQSRSPTRRQPAQPHQTGNGESLGHGGRRRSLERRSGGRGATGRSP
jgi:hypothetical protein